MSAVLLPLTLGEGAGEGEGRRRVEEPSAKYLARIEPGVVRRFDLLAGATSGVAKLRELILTLAVHGKLVPQDPSDEPTSALLKKIRVEKDRLIAEGKIKRDKPLTRIGKDEMPFELPQGWDWVRTGDICALITDGDHLPPPKADSGVPFLVIGDVRDGTINLGKASRFVPSSYFDNLDWGKRPRLGDVLYTTVGSFGIPVPVSASQDFCFQRHIALFRPAAAELQEFLTLILRSTLVFQQAEEGATGIAQKTVPLSVLREVKLPIPPLAEQSRIVARVEELMRLCDALEAKGRLEAAQHAQLVSTLLGTLTESDSPEALADNWQRIATHFDLLLDRPEAVDALEQTILQLAVRGLIVPRDPTDEPASVLLKKIRAEKDRLIAANKIKRDKPLPPIAEEDKPFELPVGWEWLRLSELLPEFQNGASSRGDVGGRPVTVLRLADIKNRVVSFADTRQVPIAERDIQKYQLKEGDILITRVNGSADIVGQFNLCGKTGGAIYCDHFIRMRVNVQWLNPMFSALLGESDLVRQRIKELFITTAGQKTVNQGHVGSLLFALPPLAEQTRIVARVEALRRLCADLRQRLSASQTTRARLAEALVAQPA
jgi:type I restriction enzyme, S subunit